MIMKNCKNFNLS